MKKVIFLLIVFILVGSFIIIRAYDIKLGNSEGRKTFFRAFLEWAGLVGKSSYNTAGYAVKQDWLPNTSKNITNENKGNSTIIKRFFVDNGGIK